MLLTSSQQAVLALWQIVNLSLSAYAKLLAVFHTAEHALNASVADWQALNLHTSHLQRFQQYIQNARQSDFLNQTLQQLANQEYKVVFYDENSYPNTLKHIFDPPPVLFYQGNVSALNMPQLAVVGSRKSTAHAKKIAFDMAQYLAYQGLWITSGMADGVDKQAHLGALSQSDLEKKGRTVAVLGTGIRQCYPKHHLYIKQQIIQSGGCVISELLPDTTANHHNFPRRNRLVAGLSTATLVVEATLQSGSLITARLTNEQGKQVFAIPSHIDNEQAKGCHQLIREGATLIDHPSQILEDLTNIITSSNLVAIPITQPTDKSTIPATVSYQPMLSDDNSIPSHLITVFQVLDWVGQDMDMLIEKTKIDIATLTGWLIELELMGKVMQQGGLYMRCR